MIIRTRFAPSPTGMLHIGGARTAIFNWIFAKKHKGNFYLRIDDTDQIRSNIKYIDSIKSGLSWLGLHWDQEIIYQSVNIDRYIKIVNNLLKQGKAYYCYTTEEEKKIFKQKNPKKKFISKWREVRVHNKNMDAVVRLKTDNNGSTTLYDKVVGKVSIKNSELDDMVLLRSNNTATYNLSCVIDDYDMKITHVIRGNDHFTNTFRQLQIFKALNWKPPIYSHTPLIHDNNGQKMSKRYDAININEYNKLGYLPKAIVSYLLTLGWSYNSEEIIDIQKAMKIFDLQDINKSPSQFNLQKLKFINQQHINHIDDNKIFQKVIKTINHQTMSPEQSIRIQHAIPLIRSRGQTINELADLASIFISYPSSIDKKSKESLQSKKAMQLLEKIFCIFQKEKQWKASSIKAQCFSFATQFNIKHSEVMKILRSSILGVFKTPPIYETLEVMSQKEVLKRISRVIKPLM